MSPNLTLRELLEVGKSELQGFSTVENPDFRLEQAEFNKEESVWEIVISYLVENTNKRVNTVLSQLSNEFMYQRIYQKLTVDLNKNVLGLYIFND